MFTDALEKRGAVRDRTAETSAGLSGVVWWKSGRRAVKGRGVERGRTVEKCGTV